MNLDERPEILRGHLSECFQHFVARLDGGAQKSRHRDTLEERLRLAEFCGVTTITLARWMNSSSPLPNGEAWIRLMCYLDTIGYRVIELERMPPVFRNIVELIGYGVFSAKDLTERLEYEQPSAIYHILSGERSASTERQQRMWDLWKEHRAQVQQRKAEATVRLTGSTPTQSPAEPGSLSTARPSGTLAAPASSVLRLMEGLLEILETNRPLSDEEIREFHAGSRTVWRLFASLTTLSERLGADRKNVDRKKR